MHMRLGCSTTPMWATQSSGRNRCHSFRWGWLASQPGFALEGQGCPAAGHRQTQRRHRSGCSSIVDACTGMGTPAGSGVSQVLLPRGSRLPLEDISSEHTDASADEHDDLEAVHRHGGRAKGAVHPQLHVCQRLSLQHGCRTDVVIYLISLYVNRSRWLNDRSCRSTTAHPSAPPTVGLWCFELLRRGCCSEDGTRAAIRLQSAPIFRFQETKRCAEDLLARTGCTVGSTLTSLLGDGLNRPRLTWSADSGTPGSSEPASSSLLCRFSAAASRLASTPCSAAVHSPGGK